ncbi:hypothetical protein A6R68_23857, partial [Neotoma lepida]
KEEKKQQDKSYHVKEEGGEDVEIFVHDLHAHLMEEVQEQNSTAHIMAFAGCLGPYTDCGLAPPAGQNSAWSRGHLLVGVAPYFPHFAN